MMKYVAIEFATIVAIIIAYIDFGNFIFVDSLFI